MLRNLVVKLFWSPLAKVAVRKATKPRCDTAYSPFLRDMERTFWQLSQKLVGRLCLEDLELLHENFDHVFCSFPELETHRHIMKKVIEDAIFLARYTEGIAAIKP